MEQLINAATPYYYIMVAFWAFGIGIICIGVIIFILSEMTAGKDKNTKMLDIPKTT